MTDLIETYSKFPYLLGSMGGVAAVCGTIANFVFGNESRLWSRISGKRYRVTPADRIDFYTGILGPTIFLNLIILGYCFGLSYWHTLLEGIEKPDIIFFRNVLLIVAVFTFLCWIGVSILNIMKIFKFKRKLKVKTSHN